MLEMLAAKAERDVLCLFYPELLSTSALADIKHALDIAKSVGVSKVHVFSFFSSRWILQELKSHSLFRHTHFFVLSLNDKLREHALLRVMDATAGEDIA